QSAITEHFQHIEYQQAHRRVVLDHQHALPLFGPQYRAGAIRHRRGWRRFGMDRQVQPDLGAAARLAGDLQVTTGLAGETVDHRQTKAGALADGFGGEEWLESAGQYLGRHAATAVDNVEG